MTSPPTLRRHAAKACLGLAAACAATTAAAAAPCDVDGFYPSSGGGRVFMEATIADPQPRIGHAGDTAWFDLVEVGGIVTPGWHAVFEVSLLRGAAGPFTVVLVRAKVGAGLNGPGPAVVDSRALPEAVADRLHRALLPVLARTHYPAGLVKAHDPARIACSDGARVYATVSAVGGAFDALAGEARPGAKDTDAGAVQALGRALREYALGHLDADDLEQALELVEARARPDPKALP